MRTKSDKVMEDKNELDFEQIICKPPSPINKPSILVNWLATYCQSIMNLFNQFKLHWFMFSLRHLQPMPNMKDLSKLFFFFE
jgi:hypothetical protein